MRHYIEQKFLNPVHPVTIVVVGAGGTGSQVLTNLAKMSHSLRQLGHPGLYIVAVDDDTVSETNIGRQAFGLGDLGQNKASILISRLNAYFGTDWTIDPIRLEKDLPKAIGGISWGYVDMLITCVDSAKARIEIMDGISALLNCEKPTYHLDFGNRKESGQAILGTFMPVSQPEGLDDVVETLPTVLDLFPHIAEMDDEVDLPSCSTREALEKQDLFVNSTLANLGIDLFWSLFRQGYIEIHGGFMSVNQFTASPLHINFATWERFGYKAA